MNGPTVISARRAAETLGIGVFELDEAMRSDIARRLGDLSHEITGFGVPNLDAFDRRMEGIRRLVESALVLERVWKAEENVVEGNRP